MVINVEFHLKTVAPHEQSPGRDRGRRLAQVGGSKGQVRP